APFARALAQLPRTLCRRPLAAAFAGRRVVPRFRRSCRVVVRTVPVRFPGRASVDVALHLFPFLNRPEKSGRSGANVGENVAKLNGHGAVFLDSGAIGGAGCERGGAAGAGRAGGAGIRSPGDSGAGGCAGRTIDGAGFTTDGE